MCDLREFDVSYKALFTKDAAEVYSDPEIGIVVECMGGKGAAYRFVKAALVTNSWTRCGWEPP